MDVKRLLSLTTTLLRDAATPPKWSVEDKLEYLNEAQEIFAAEVQSLVEVNYSLSLTAGEDLYDLDDTVVMVLGARYASGSRLRLGSDDRTPYGGSGFPLRYVLDTTTQTIRFFPIPDEDVEITLRVRRAPTPMTSDDLDMECELPKRAQRLLPDWAAYRCWTHDDVDGRNDNAAAMAKDRFDAGVRDLKRKSFRSRTGVGARVHGNRII